MVLPNKRKRKDANRVDISPEITKRVKVHAQRKFAQGALCPPIILPLRDELPKPQQNQPTRTIQLQDESTSTKRPRTEDFLTFLCFRGTSILPTNLDFLNYAHGSTEITSESPVQEVINNNNASTSTNLTDTPKVITPPNFIPFGVRKRASVFPEKSNVRKIRGRKSNECKDVRTANQIKMDKTRQHRVTVHALRKKYQEQKMAKLRAVAFSKISDHSVQTRSCASVRVPKQVLKKSASVIPKPKLKPIPKPLPVKPKPQVVPKVMQTKRQQKLAPNKVLIKKRMCLRSSSTVNIPSRPVRKQVVVVKKVVGRPKSKVSNIKVEDKVNKKLVVKLVKDEVKIKATKKVDVKTKNSEFSSDDDEPLLKVHTKRIKPNLKNITSKNVTSKNVSTKLKAIEPKIVPKKLKKDEDSDVSKSTKTVRPSRKTKEAATLYMELLGQRLNTSNNFDEDNSSLDSFPELPNVRKTEQMENELKAQVNNNKSTYSDSSTIKPSKVEVKKKPKAKPKPKVKKVSIKRNEKSFSDSDEEPLALKISTKNDDISEALKKISTMKKCMEANVINTNPAPNPDEQHKVFGVAKREHNDDIKSPLYNKLYQKASAKDSDNRIDLQRKRKVNMSSEEIEKWLSESCQDPEPMEDDLVMSDLDIKKFKESVESRKKFFDKKGDRKSMCQQKRNASAKAFSPENETSVYSFCLDDQGPPPISTPFRKNLLLDKKQDKFASPKAITVVDASKDLDLGNMKSSIAVQCDFQTDQQAAKITLPQGNLADFRNMEISTQTDYALANEGHLFYIPLQNSKTGENISEHLIQGVAVKLGTEGPDGPNQRVIMRAKLVTKAQMSSTSSQPQLATSSHETLTALSPSEDALIMAKKPIDLPKSRRSNPPPVGTVQPLSRDEKPVPTNQSTQFKSYLKEMDKRFKVGDNVPHNFDVKVAKNSGEILDAPTFYPSEKQFLDPIAFIEQITPIASKFGLCRIVPPASFKPECKIGDDMRFTAYNQYVNRMMYRFGPCVQELLAIKKYLETQSITLTHAPFIGGMEIDLPRLYHTVQNLGGLKEVIEKKKWHRVAEEMCIPKSAQDRVTKLDDIYCKYLLPYDTLSPAERQKLLAEVKQEWTRKETLYRQKQHEKNQHYKQYETDTQPRDTDSESNNSMDDFDSETDRDLRECTLKGRNMALSQFFRIARNTMSVWFKNGSPEPSEVEKQYWDHVSRRDKHICVHVGSIDSSGFGYGFPIKSSPVARHPWNLKVLTNNNRSVLRSLGPVMGLTVPTLHVGMLFSACCWYRDPHGLPWIEYLHTGANKIWYGIPDRASDVFRDALSVLAPQSVLPQTIWLPSDSAMIPPGELLSRNVPLSRTVQRPGEFVLVCPRAYTSSLCTGYAVSESVYYATTDWLEGAQQDFKDIQESREPTMFSLDQLLVSIASDARAQDVVLKSIVEPLQELVKRENTEREQLLKIINDGASDKKSDKYQSSVKVKELKDKECDVCRANLFVSMVSHKEEDSTMCLRHAIRFLNQKRQKIANENQKTTGKKKILITERDFLNNWQLVYSYSIEDLEALCSKVKTKVEDNESVVLDSVASSVSGGKAQVKKKKGFRT